MRKLILAFVIGCTLAAPAAARDIFVNNLAGDDRSYGERNDHLIQRAGPVRTIAKACRLAEPGDRIVLAKTEEPYRESVSLVGLKHSASPVMPLVLDGRGATLDGSMPVPWEAWEHYSGNVFRFRPERLAHQQLFLAGRPAVHRPPQGIDGTVPALAPLEWSLTGGYLYFRVEPGRLPDFYEPSYAVLQTGVTLYQVRGAEVVDLVVQGFQLDGINVFDTSVDVRLAGITARGNGRSGISVGGASQVEIVECLVGDNGRAQLRTEGYSHTRVSDSELIGNTAPAEVVDGGELWVDGQRVPGKHD